MNSLTINTEQRSIHVLPQTNRLKYLHLKVRDAKADKQIFTFYADQIIRLLLEHAVNLLPYQKDQVVTAIGQSYSGTRLATPVNAVSVVRAGESMEFELRNMFPEFGTGKILIQRDPATKKANLFFTKLPDNIHQGYVLLLEPMLATGGSLIKAVEVLTQHGVDPQKIIVINLLASPEGLTRLINECEGIRLVTSSVEEGLNENAFMIPGIGDFGDRYFGTKAVMSL